MPPLPDHMLLPAAGGAFFLASIVLAWICVVRVRRASARNTVQILVASERIVEHLLQLQASVAVTDGRLAVLAGRFEEHTRRCAPGAPASYSVAIRMARSGASRQELMASCGVTQQEADLIMRLHARDGRLQHAAA